MKKSLDLLHKLGGVEKMTLKQRDEQSRITRTRSDGTRFVELKDAVLRQQQERRFDEMKRLNIEPPPPRPEAR